MTRPPRFPVALDRLHGSTRNRSAAAAPDVLRPQRPLHHAAEVAARQAVPSGLGLDSAAVRQRMVQRLRDEGLNHPAVLLALGSVERHRFVDSALANQAYEDTSLPIGWQQTISKPSVVARMLQLLLQGQAACEQGHLGRVLEIGTGCGYQAALLARLARSVVSIERLGPLHQKARDNLRPLHLGDVRLLHADGRLGHAPRAPYTSIVAAAGGDALPPAWLEQLAVGGRLVAPMHHAGRGGQVLAVVDRSPQGLRTEYHDAVHFVPLKSGAE